MGRKSFAQARFVVAEQRASRDLRSVRVRENERASQPAGESERFALRERVRVFEIVATAKVPISGASVVVCRRTRILSLLGHRRDRFAEKRSARLDLRVRRRGVRRTDSDSRILLHGQACERGLLLPVSIVRANTETLDQRQREFSRAVQTGRNELASRVQRSREHGHDVRGVQRPVREMLETTLRFRGHRQGSCHVLWQVSTRI